MTAAGGKNNSMDKPENKACTKIAWNGTMLTDNRVVTSIACDIEVRVAPPEDTPHER